MVAKKRGKPNLKDFLDINKTSPKQKNKKKESAQNMSDNSNINETVCDSTNDINSGSTEDITVISSNHITNNEISDITDDVTNNVTSNKTNNGSLDATSSGTSNITPNNTDDITDYVTDLVRGYYKKKTQEIMINAILPQSMRAKYTDTHERKTWYFTKENLKNIQKFQSLTGLDASATVNMALDIFFTLVNNRVALFSDKK